MLLEKRWQPTMVLLLGALVLLSLAGGILLAAIVTRLAGPRLTANGTSLVTLVIMVSGFQGATLIWVHQFLKIQNITWGEAFGLSQENYGKCVITALVALPFVLGGVLMLGSVSNWLLGALHEQLHWKWLKPELQPAVQLLRENWPVHLLVLQGVVAIIIAPVAEEVLFRGVLYTAIKQRGHRQTALWSTALLFALIHFYPAGFLSLIFLAAVLVVVYERTRNIFAPILLHALFNGVNFAIIVTHPKWAENLFKT